PRGIFAPRPSTPVDRRKNQNSRVLSPQSLLAAYAPSYFIRAHGQRKFNRAIKLFYSPTCPHFVIPAKAGIHHLTLKFRVQVLDPRLRGGDDKRENIIFWIFLCPTNNHFGYHDSHESQMA
ncbi:MAG: hypothetical protein ABL928_13745, partial [Sphingorhabdus sp.]